MKTHAILTVLTLLLTISLKSQTKVGYYYDNNGNRYQRYFIGFKQGNPQDTASAQTDSLLNTLSQTPPPDQEQKLAEDKGVKIFPNPTRDIVTVNISKNGIKESKTTRMYLVDNYGRILETKDYTGTGISFDLGKNPAGNYYLRIVFDTKETLTYLVVKVN